MTVPAHHIPGPGRDDGRPGATRGGPAVEAKRRVPAPADLPASPRGPDGLTGLAARDEFRGALEEAARQAGRQGVALSLILLDVDRLKSHNEALGHRGGDDILRSVADLLRSGQASAGLVARCGGGEFAVLLPSSEAAAAVQSAERLRMAIEANPWPRRPVTASFGVATLHPAGPGTAALLDRAGQALAWSKRGGCNRVSHADDVGTQEDPS